MATLAEIDRLTKDYSDARDRLGDTVTKLEDAIEALKRQYLPGITNQVRIAKEKEAALRAAIDEGRELFKRPKTLILHGIKIGFEKAKGKIEFVAADQVVRLIEKFYPEQADVLIKTTKKPRKKALAGLSAAELKKLGITIQDTGDAIVISPVDSQIEKLVSKLLNEKTEDAEEEAA